MSKRTSKTVKAHPFGPEVSLCFGTINVLKELSCSNFQSLTAPALKACSELQRNVLLHVSNVQAAVYEVGLALNDAAPYRWPVVLDVVGSGSKMDAAEERLEGAPRSFANVPAPSS